MRSKAEPIRVERSRGRHRTEYRWFATEMREHVCVHRGCKFRGRTAVQGVCYRDESDVADLNKVARMESRIQEDLVAARRAHYRGDLRGYSKWLEGHYVSAMLNWSFGIDDLVRLRAENALLRLRLDRKGRKTSRS